MDRLLKINGALTAISAGIAAILFAMSVTSAGETNGSRLGERALASTTGWSPNYLYATGNGYCACNFAQQNQSAGIVCDCNGNLNSPCVICTGTLAGASGEYSVGGTGWEPSGGTSDCNTLGALAGTCAPNALGILVCQNAILPFGACPGTYPLFQFQFITMAGGPASASTQSLR